MATDDCFEVGKGPCPCGKGIITVEKCIPDHPWAKESQASYTPALVCDSCEPKYAFFNRDLLSAKSRLVPREDLERHRKAEKEWHQKLREIESSEEFKKLAKLVAIQLAREKSAAARYRVLQSAGLTGSLSIGRYRQSGFTLHSMYAKQAMKLVGAEMPEVSALAEQAEYLAAEMYRPLPTIKTGINGLAV